MFEIGKRYQIKMLSVENTNAGEFCSFNGIVVDFEFPLVKIKNGGSEKIINTQSNWFIAAELSGCQSDELPVMHMGEL